ncbi:hypothetical protein LCGC14_1512570, partial [marine sediment metagenome]
DPDPDYYFGDGHAGDRFVDIINKDSFWKIKKQKEFNI